MGSPLGPGLAPPAFGHVWVWSARRDRLPLSMFGSGQPVGTSRLQAVLGLVSPVPQAHPPQIVLRNGLLTVPLGYLGSLSK